MRRTGLDFAITCPRIDREIGSAKEIIQRFLDDLLSDACGLLPDDVRDKLAREQAELLYNDLESCFEAVRESNENMRKQADRQISDLQDELSAVEAELQYFKVSA